MKTKSSAPKGIIPVAFLVVAALAIAGLSIYLFTGKNTLGKETSRPNQWQTFFSNLLGNKFAITPTKTAAMFLGAKTTKSIDLKTGMGGVEVKTFSSKDPVIYVVMQVNKPAKGTKFEYTRYFNGKYVDHKSLDTTKDGVSYVSFSWRLKNAKSKHLSGDYRLKLYVNGNFVKEIFYQVR